MYLLCERVILPPQSYVEIFLEISFRLLQREQYESSKIAAELNNRLPKHRGF